MVLCAPEILFTIFARSFTSHFQFISLGGLPQRHLVVLLEFSWLREPVVLTPYSVFGAVRSAVLGM